MQPDPAISPPAANRRALPRSVVMLGFASLFMDISSEMIHALLPRFLVTVVGASALSIGIIEGIAEAMAAFVKVFSGAISDWIGRRKPLLLLGYGLAAVCKPLFAIATGIGTVLTARTIDRIAKGIRGAPRDALIADVTPADMRGAAYGLRQSLDTIGGVAGPLLAIVLMAATADDFRFVFWIAVIPAFVCVALIVFGIHEPAHTQPTKARLFPINRSEMARLPRIFWQVTALAFVVPATKLKFRYAFKSLQLDKDKEFIAEPKPSGF